MEQVRNITVVFSVISSLFLLSQARYVVDDFSSTALTFQDRPEDTDRKAIAVPLEKPSSSGESIPAIEGFHHVVDLSLRRPIDRQFLLRETAHSSGRIRFPRRLRGEMQWNPTRTSSEADDVSGMLEKALAQDLTEVHAEEPKKWIPVEWKAKEAEEEEHERKKKKRVHKKKKEREEDSDSDSDSDDDEEEKMEIKKKKKKKKGAKQEEEGGLMRRFWAFLNRF